MKNSDHPLVILAKEAIEKYISQGKTISPPESFPKNFLAQKAGVFVSINNNGDLRGCIGTYAPTKENIAYETIANAISASSQDTRFGPITVDELPSLDYDVYVLEEPRLIADLSELDVKKYGIVVVAEGSPKCGLLLPNLEGIKTIEEQINIASKKGGIDPKKEKIAIYRFTAEKY
ncbi:MAG: AmmeMemoRadiSam system protein A [Candidatus Nealsonbacteria bacterium]|nr:AmmeMemoRadiSam system protein A [Candidatus Nealsonbacteria bacterium]